MNIKTLLLVILTVGVTFNMIARVSAVEAVCLPVEPHVAAAPVCIDVPLGPRFKVRR